MNERIKELWTQGTFNVVPRAGDYSSVSAEQIEKFAELIVRECTNIVLHYTDVDEGVAVAKKHFGVEE